MVTVQQLSKIVSAYKKGNYEYADKILLSIIEELEQEKKYKVAKDLRNVYKQPLEIIQNNSNKALDYNASNLGNNKLYSNEGLFEIRDSMIGLDDIVLSAANREIVNEIINNFHNKDLFASYNLDSRTRILAYGPPGTGKTLFAYALAGELNIPVLHVQLDQLISSYLGETGKNIRKIFESASTSRYIILLDEFDAIAKQRDDVSELGELKRVVTVLLQHIDNLSNNNILIAATNHPHLLDSAVTRRFEYLLNMDNLDYKSLIDLYRLYLKNYSFTNSDYIELSKVSTGISGAIIKQIVDKGIKNRLTLNQVGKTKRKRDDDDFKIPIIKNYILDEILHYKFGQLSKNLNGRTTRELKDTEKIQIASIIKTWQKVENSKYAYKDYAEIIHLPIATLNNFVKKF